MIRLKKETATKIKSRENNESSIKAGFSFDYLKIRILEIFASKKHADRKLSRRIFDMVPNSEAEPNRKRSRSTSHLGKRNNRGKSRGKAYTWLNKSLLVIGNIRISRVAAAITMLAVIVLASGSIALAAGGGVFKEEMPIENVDLVPAQKMIYIQDNDETILVPTNGGTVSDILKTNNIKISDEDIVYPSLNTVAYNRMQLEIKRAMDVTVKTYDEEQSLIMYEGTVADALDEAGIEYDEDDLIAPDLEAALADKMLITFDLVEIKIITEEVTVEYETEYGETSTVLKGLYAITQKGKDGSAEVTYEVKYINGVESSRKAIKENMIKEPVNKIVLNGTGLTRAGSDAEEGEPPADVKNPDEQSTNPTVPGTTSSYVDTVVAHVTAYTHTGHTTATGTWPRSTRTLENPGSCAVVPNTFPYGSLLYVPGYGYCIAEDTGGFRHDPDRWNQIDVFMNTAQECVVWGRKREWKIYVIRYGY